MNVQGYKLTAEQIRQAFINTYSPTINRSSDVLRAWRNEKGQRPVKDAGSYQYADVIGRLRYG